MAHSRGIPRLKVHTQDAAWQAAPAIKPNSRLTRSRLTRATTPSYGRRHPAGYQLVRGRGDLVHRQPTGLGLDPSESLWGGQPVSGQRPTNWWPRPGLVHAQFRLPPSSCGRPPASAHRSQPVFSAATIQDSVPACQAPTARPGSRPVSARSSTHGVPSGRTCTRPVRRR